MKGKKEGLSTSMQFVPGAAVHVFPAMVREVQVPPQWPLV